MDKMAGELRLFWNARDENMYVLEVKTEEPLNAPFLNGLFSSGFSRGKTAP